MSPAIPGTRDVSASDFHDTPAPALIARLRQARAVLITSHTNPDGDAVGSELALLALLHQQGTAATIWNRDPIPSALRSMDASGSIHSGEKPPRALSEFDLAVALECPTPARIGLDRLIETLPTLNIDHHLGNSNYGVENWVEPRFAAVSLMVMRLGDALGLTLEGEICDLLLAALMSDTGGFRFGNTTPECLRDAARLVAAGASPEKVSRWLYEARPLAAMKLAARLLENLQLAGEGRVAVASLSRHDFAAAGATPEDAEGLVDYPRSIAGVDAVGLLREVGDGVFKASLRSRGVIDVERIARSFSGGGHRNAAGCTLEGDLPALRAMLRTKLLAAVADTQRKETKHGV